MSSCRSTMENSAAPLSSISFTSSSNISSGSSSYNMCSSSVYTAGSSLEVVSLCNLSINLEHLLVDPSFDYSDADIVVEGIVVGVHRCILAARSKFFHECFNRDKELIKKEGKPKYCMKDLLPYGRVGYDAFLVLLSYLYTGKLKPPPLEVSTCVDDVCIHDVCRPAINFAVELMYASSVFEVTELASLFQRRLLNFVDKAHVEDVIPILLVAFHCKSSQLLYQCSHRVARSNLDSISLEKELPSETMEDVRSLRKKFLVDDGNNVAALDPIHEKSIRKILKALDSDDIELVKLLLSESNIGLDEANALHYAAAYCDPKVVSELLNLGLADVNLRNARGYTVLHIAAMRKEPGIIVSLLSKGACASKITMDGRNAVNICRRLTRPKDYHAKIERGKEANQDKICIDVLEREMHRNPMAIETSISSPVMADDLHMKLLHLENRVAFARLLYPTEAKLAMDNAHAETTSEFAGHLATKSSSGNLREVNLNETPIMQNKRLLSRMEALSRTVEFGRRYFPHCAQVLDKFMEDDLPDAFYLEKGTPEEQKLKRTRFIELKEDVQRAFSKDRAKLHRCILSPSSSFLSENQRHRGRK